MRNQKGKPAAKAGLQKGDIIIKLGEINVGSTNDYMKALSTFKKDDTAEIIVVRDGKEIKMKITF